MKPETLATLADEFECSLDGPHGPIYQALLARIAEAQADVLRLVDQVAADLEHLRYAARRGGPGTWGDESMADHAANLTAARLRLLERERALRAAQRATVSS